MRKAAGRIAITVGALTAWFWTQSLIGQRASAVAGIGDQIHIATQPLNLYLQTHPSAANALLIVSSAVIDLLALFLLGKWVLRGELRPFLGLVMVMALRQIVQALVSLPAPPHAIWRDPGFPSLLVTYGVGNDYFFSGHTAIAVLGAMELVRERRSLLVLGTAVVVFEAATVLVLRAHYTMDVFAGLATAFWAAHLSERAAAFLTTRLAAKPSG